jgi:hypothetical protein
VKNLALALVVAAGIAAPALAQTQPAEGTGVFEFQIVPIGASAGLTSGGSSASATQTFAVQARVSTPNNTLNYGIGRWSQTTTGSTMISSTNGQLSRGMVSATAYGRNDSGGVTTNFQNASFTGGNFGVDGSNTATLNPTAAEIAAGNDNTTNGVFNAGRTAITLIDAYLGNTFAALPGGGAPSNQNRNPFRASLITDGSFSPWVTLYAIDVTASSFGATSVPAQGVINSAGNFQYENGGWIPTYFNAVTPVSASFSFNYIPTPGAAALLGLGGLMAARRRR